MIFDHQVIFYTNAIGTTPTESMEGRKIEALGGAIWCNYKELTGTDELIAQAELKLRRVVLLTRYEDTPTKLDPDCIAIVKRTPEVILRIVSVVLMQNQRNRYHKIICEDRSETMEIADEQ